MGDRKEAEEGEKEEEGRKRGGGRGAEAAGPDMGHRSAMLALRR